MEVADTLDIRGAVERFRLLNAEEGEKPEGEPEPERVEEEPEEVPEVEGEPEVETEGEPEKAEVSEGADEEVSEDVKTFAELAEHLELEQDYLLGLEVEAKIDGESKRLPLKELLNSYQKSAAADKRLAEAAEARKALETERQAQLEQLSSAKAIADQVLESQWSQLQEQEKAISSLQEDDPAEYAARMIQLQKMREGLQGQYGRLQGEYQKAITEAQQKALEENSKRIPELIPEWTDGERASTEKKALVDYLSKHFSEREIGSIADARFVAISRKAMLYDELQSKSKKVVQKVKTLPKRLSGGPAKGADNAKQAELKKLQARHKKSGNIASALALYKARRGS